MNPVSYIDNGFIIIIIRTDIHIGRYLFESKKKNLQTNTVMRHKADLIALIFSPVNTSKNIITTNVIIMEIFLLYDINVKSEYNGKINIPKCVPDILNICDNPLF